MVNFSKRVTMSIILTACILPSQVFALSLMESIQLAFDKNPKTRANDLRVEAAHDRVKGAELDLLPSISVGFNRSQYAYSPAEVPSTKSYSSDLSVSTQVNLFNGFSDVNSIKSSKAAAQAMDARFNSTDALIPNTKGSLALNVGQSYFSILFNKSQILYFASLEPIYTKLLKSVKNKEEESILKNAILSTRTSLIAMRFSEQSARRDFEYYTRTAAPEQIDNFDRTIADLAIPSTSEEAFEIALSKSPSVKARQYDLESAQLDYKADKGRTHSPRVDLYVSKNLERSPGESSSSMVGLSVRYSFSPGAGARNSSSAKQVESARLDRDGALDDLKRDLDDYYPSLANYEELHEKYLEAYSISRQNIVDILAKIDAGQKVDVQAAISNVDSLTNAFMNLLMQKKNLANMRFNIQRTIGTLFELAKTN